MQYTCGSRGTADGIGQDTSGNTIWILQFAGRCSFPLKGRSRWENKRFADCKRCCIETVNGRADRLALAEVLEHHGVTEHSSFTTLRDLKLTTRVDQPCTLWTFPLETVTNSEAGYERGYQGTVYLHIWQLQLGPHASWQGNLTQRVTAYNP